MPARGTAGKSSRGGRGRKGKRGGEESQQAPLNELLKAAALALEDESLFVDDEESTADSYKPVIRELVKAVTTLEEKLSQMEKKLDDVVEKISAPETNTATTNAAPATNTTTTTIRPRKRRRRDMSPKSKEAVEEQLWSLKQIEGHWNDKMYCDECTMVIRRKCFIEHHWDWCTIHEQMVKENGHCRGKPVEWSTRTPCKVIRSSMTESEIEECDALTFSDILDLENRQSQFR